MPKREYQIFFTILFGIVWILASYSLQPSGNLPVNNERIDTASSSPKESLWPSSASIALYPVVHVVDGDTIDVQKDGQKVRIRFIGINAPESVDPRRPVGCFGIEASNEMKRLLTGESVSLETDSSQDTHDKYGRLLAYVYLPDGSDVGLHMIESGFAYEYTYRLPYAHQDQYKAAQQVARAEARGLWAADTCSGRL